MRYIANIIFIILFSGCATSMNKELVGHADDLKSHQRFGVCYGYGCKYYQKTGLSDQEWQAVREVFLPVAKTPEEERGRISKAIARIEQFIGPKTGTDNDKARAAVINFSTRTEMDCIDEAFNSTSYLYLMRQSGFIKFHRLGAHLRRNLEDLSYPHSTATIHEIGKEKIIEGDGHFVVDSWFHQNGAAAEVIPADIWKGPWYPKKYKERYIFSES